MSAQAFGKRLAQLRREKAVDDHRDLDRREVAKAIGASPSSVTRWENGEVFPGEDTLADLAKYYGVTRSWLRFGEGERTAPPVERPMPRPMPRPTATAKAPEAAARKRRQG